MIVFFLIASILVVLVLALLLPSLGSQHRNVVDRRELNISIARAKLAELTRKHADGEMEAQEFNDEKQRLERDLAGDIAVDTDKSSANNEGGRWMVWPLAVFVPVMAGVVYLTVGTPDAINPPAAPSVAVETEQAPPTPDMRAVVERIKEQLQQQPDDATGWFMLGRAHMTLGEFDDAVAAIRKADELNADNPEIMVRLADAIAMSQQGRVAGEPEQYLIKALALQPDNLQGLWLLGIAQNERGDGKAAITTWKKLLPLVDDDQSLIEVRQLIADAEQTLATTEQATDLPAASDETMLTVEVSLAPGLAENLPPETVIFVYAKAALGPPMPLAVARKTVADLPFTVQLSDRDAMMPTMKLSAFESVVVGARVSRTGNAIAQSGDLFEETGDIASTQTEPVKIAISRVVE